MLLQSRETTEVAEEFGEGNVNAGDLSNVMGLQRLIDLNRQIRSLNFLVQRNKMLIQMQANSDLRQLPQKQNKRLKHLIKVSKEEASDLTSLMTEHLHSLEYNNAFRFCELSTGFRENAWNLGICSLNEGSLPIAIWQLLSQNIDVWSVHASRKSLKAFSSLLIHHWVNYYSNHKHSVEQDTKSAMGNMKTKNEKTRNEE